MRWLIPAALMFIGIFILSSYAAPMSVTPVNLQTKAGLVTCACAVSSAKISIQITDYSGNVLTTVASNVQTPTFGPAKTQIILDVDGTPINIPSGGYLLVTIISPSSSIMVYWGTAQPSNFQAPYRTLT